MSEQEKILSPNVEQTPTEFLKNPETLLTPEETVEKKSAETKGEAAPTPAAPTPVKPINAPTAGLLQEAERVAEIERILEGDLSEVYFHLPENKRELFRAQGENTAQQINTLLASAKLRVNKIISLIKKWLTLIPGVNKFFLEQEAKLKADQIIKLHDKF